MLCPHERVACIRHKLLASRLAPSVVRHAEDAARAVFESVVTRRLALDCEVCCRFVSDSVPDDCIFYNHKPSKIIIRLGLEFLNKLLEVHVAKSRGNA